MNGTIIDIPDIHVSVNSIHMEDSTDRAHIITLTDGKKEVTINISYGKITEVRCCKL